MGISIGNIKDSLDESVPVLVLLFVALWYILRSDLFYVLPCVILFMCFTVLSALRLPRLGKTELSLDAFCRFVQFALVWFCLFPLPLGVWEGLRFVLVGVPGLFSYLFFLYEMHHISPLCCSTKRCSFFIQPKGRQATFYGKLCNHMKNVNKTKTPIIIFIYVPE